MKTFKSDKNKVLYYFMWCITIGLGGLFFIQQPEQDEVSVGIFYVIIVSTITFLVWILVYTQYTISNNILYCYSGPLSCKININTITKIETDDTVMKTTLLKLSLSHKGFIIHYNTFDTVFISPKDKIQFIETMLDANPTILIKY